jgi:hypothetical protein
MRESLPFWGHPIGKPLGKRALREHIDQLEPSLIIIDGQKEQAVRSGRIDITARGAIGNSMAVPVMRWIGERMSRVESLMRVGSQAEAAQ